MRMDDALKSYSNPETLDMKGFAQTIDSVTLPVTLLQTVLGPGLTHVHATVRDGCSRLLTCVLDQLSAHVKFLVEHKLVKPSAVTGLKKIISNRLQQV